MAHAIYWTRQRLAKSYVIVLLYQRLAIRVARVVAECDVTEQSDVVSRAHCFVKDARELSSVVRQVLRVDCRVLRPLRQPDPRRLRPRLLRQLRRQPVVGEIPDNTVARQLRHVGHRQSSRARRESTFDASHCDAIRLSVIGHDNGVDQSTRQETLPNMAAHGRSRYSTKFILKI